MNKTLKKAVLAVATPIMRRAARSYIAGPELEDALRVVRKLAARNFLTTTGFWDDVDADPSQVAAAHIAAVRALGEVNSNSYVSLKAPSVRYQRDLLSQIADASNEVSIRLHFDSLDAASVDPTFELISDLLPNCQRIGCTLPGRWQRSLGDADWAVARGLWVRVVKGQWPDPDGEPADLRARYLNVIERLAGRATHVGVATHDPAVARPALESLKRAGTPCELEVLFGLPVDAVLAVARSLDVRVRFYIPYGHAWLPYSLSQAKRNPRILWWTFKDMFFGRPRDSVYS